MFQPPLIQIEHKGYLITSDKRLLQPAAVHQWLSTQSHWAQNIPFDTVQQAIDHSFCVGALFEGRQIGFARLITDYAIFGYLADVYVEAFHRNQGLATTMCSVMLSQEWAKSLRRILLSTKDAHAVYTPLGFTALRTPERMMEILLSNPYLP